jgi:hypothetical protein
VQQEGWPLLARARDETNGAKHRVFRGALGPARVLSACRAQAGHQPEAKREPRSVLCYTYHYNSLVDSTFEQSKNVTIVHFNSE